MPERDTPGSIATACATPIRRARRNDTSFSPFGRNLVAVSTTPVNISANPTMRADAKAASMLSLRHTPTIPAGTALSTTLAMYDHSMRTTMRRITEK